MSHKEWTELKIREQENRLHQTNQTIKKIKAAILELDQKGQINPQTKKQLQK